MGVPPMSRKCMIGCSCGRHTAVHPGGPRPGARMPLDEFRLRELAPLLTQVEIAAELGSTRKVVQNRMKELGIQGRPESLTWAAKHQRLRKVRGRAAEHQCVKCPAQARDWAQIHTEDGTDPWADYVPLCRKCHLNYDYEAHWNEESLAKWRTSAGPAIAAAWTPERRAAQSRYAQETRRRHPNIQDPSTGRIVGIS